MMPTEIQFLELQIKDLANHINTLIARIKKLKKEENEKK